MILKHLILVLIIGSCLAGCMTARVNPTMAPAPIAYPGSNQNNDLTQQTGAVNTNVNKMKNEITGLKAQVGSVATNVDARLTGVETQLHDVITSISTNINTNVEAKLIGFENRIQSNFQNSMEARLGDIITTVSGTASAQARDVITSFTSEISLLRKTVNDIQSGFAGRDLDQSRNKYGGIIVAVVSVVAMLLMFFNFKLMRDNSRQQRELRTIQRGLISQGWTVASKGSNRSVAPPELFDEKSAKLFNWEEFAPPSKVDFLDQKK